MKKIFVLLLAWCFISSTILAGGGWTKKKGTAYYKVGHWWVNASKQYTFDGSTSPNPKEGIYNTSIYAEYGITDKLTGIINLPYSKSANNVESVSGIGDTDIALKYRLNKTGSKYVVAGTILFGLPLGDESGGTNGMLQTGDGEFNQSVRLDASRSYAIQQLNAYANIYIGFNNRTHNFSDEFRGGAEFGISFLNNRIWGIARLDIVESLQNGAKSTAASDGATIFANNTEFVSITYEVAGYVTKKMGFSAAYGSVFSAANIFAAPSYSLGVFLDMK